MENQPSARDVHAKTSCDDKPARSHQRHEHGGACCSGHHHHQHSPTNPGPASFLGSLLPILACALCPACLSVWAQVLSFVGIGVIVTESQHHFLLGVALLVAFVTSAYAFAQTRFVGPFVLTVVACVLVAGSHFFAEENHVLSWFSIAVLLGASLWQRRKVRSAQKPGRVSSVNSAFASPTTDVT